MRAISKSWSFCNRRLYADLGKSSFLYYLLLRQLSDKKPTALQLLNCTILFQDTGVRVYYGQGDVAIPEGLPEGTLALTGIYKHAKAPCDAFQSAERDGEARIIQATSLPWNSWKEWHEEHQARVYVMDNFSVDERRAFGSAHVTWQPRFFLAEFLFPQKYPSFQCRQTRPCLQ